ncbi:DUF2514 family protein [Rhizobacter sp. Root1221]|uniref:DUF2514 family protein n=1 Tax=Rhizobacter sp. Root1221 TaxID=1736433 RepID=UPI000712FADE|nr:DUF2514 family protein [Rhizobacter sp. Root1221]KQV85419.1 hypothetical protein ASC87_06935 [Rhizobacter sp. Root1221]
MIISPRLMLAGAIAAIVVATVTAQEVRIGNLKTELSELRSTTARQREAAVTAAISVLKARLLEGERRARLTQEALDDERTKRENLAADHAAAVGAGEQLRAAATRAARRCAGAADSTDAGGGAPTFDTGMVLADVLSRMEARGADLADLAGRRGLAGETCERERDALTTP